MPSCCIIVPVYKLPLSCDEYLSLRQTVTVLRNWKIIIVKPCSLVINDLTIDNNANSTISGNISFVSFDDHFFESISGYNKLMLSRQFYSKFKVWDYILICQLDAWIFQDNLIEWLNLDFSYIGAPWLDLSSLPLGMSGHRESVGNGGLSLRKVKDIMSVLSSWKYFYWPVLSIQELLVAHKPLAPLESGTGIHQLLRVFNRLLIIFIRLLSWRNSLYSFASSGLNEDIVLTQLSPRLFKYLRLPSISLAARFSLDVDAEYFYTRYVYPSVPFGCHGWSKINSCFLRSMLVRFRSLSST